MTARPAVHRRSGRLRIGTTAQRGAHAAREAPCAAARVCTFVLKTGVDMDGDGCFGPPDCGVLQAVGIKAVTGQMDANTFSKPPFSRLDAAVIAAPVFVYPLEAPRAACQARRTTTRDNAPARVLNVA
jgi:hypothetical protein